MRKTGLILLSLVASACGIRVASTPLPTLTPTTSVTEAPQIPTYIIDNRQSIIDYIATGPLNITIPGTFSLKGHSVRLVPEGDGYRIKIDALIDGNSVTAVNGLVRDALRASLEVDKYPFGRFIADSKEIVRPAAMPMPFTAAGTVELHGRTRTVEIPITITITDGKLTATLETRLDLLDYEVNVPTAIMSSKVTFKAAIVALQESAIDPSPTP
jgi:polyisoprenoid-binding protein YceI